MTPRLLHAIGITLIVIGFVSLAFSFAARNAARRTTDELSARLDTIAARVDAVRNGPQRSQDVEAISAELDETARKVTGLKSSHDSPTSVKNLWLLVYSGLTIVGGGFIIAGSLRRRSTHTRNGGSPGDPAGPSSD